MREGKGGDMLGVSYALCGNASHTTVKCTENLYSERKQRGLESSKEAETQLQKEMKDTK